MYVYFRMEGFLAIFVESSCMNGYVYEVEMISDRLYGTEIDKIIHRDAHLTCLRILFSVVSVYPKVALPRQAFQRNGVHSDPAQNSSAAEINSNEFPK